MESQFSWWWVLNATQAAIRAGYSKKRADQIGFENLRKPDIQAAIGKARKVQTKRTLITADRVLQELALPAFLDPAGFFDANGNLLEIHEMQEETRHVIAAIDVDQKTTEDGNTCTTKKIKISDKLKALELLGRHFKLFTDKTELSGTDGKPIEQKWVVEVVGVTDAKD